MVCDDDKLKQKHTLSIQFQNLTENRRYRGTIDIPNTHIHEISLPWVATGNSIKDGSVKLVYGQIYMDKRCVLIWKGVLLQQGKGKSINKTLANPIAYAFRTTQNMLEII